MIELDFKGRTKVQVLSDSKCPESGTYTTINEYGFPTLVIIRDDSLVLINDNSTSIVDTYCDLDEELRYELTPTTVSITCS